MWVGLLRGDGEDMVLGGRYAIVIFDIRIDDCKRDGNWLMALVSKLSTWASAAAVYVACAIGIPSDRRGNTEVCHKCVRGGMTPTRKYKCKLPILSR